MTSMLGHSGRPRLTGARVLGMVLGLVLAFLVPTQAESPPETAASDVRILIDISGSMRDTDPQNRRTPAINLLIDAIPDDATAGIWSFGRYVNLLMPHDPISAEWRARARQQVGELRAIAQRTNLGAALDDAAYDFGFSTYSPPTDVILITDGQVDIAPNTDVNRVERDRILDTVIPRFAAAGARIHTLALGDAADAGLLEQMASQTGGVFAEVRQPAEMQSFVVRVLNSVSPGNELPFDGREFTVDDQVTELTAMVMHDDGEVQLRQPGGALNSVSSPGQQRWQAGEGYTLVTIDSPQPGRWEVLGDISDDSRIQVVSDVNLFWTHPSGSVVLQDQPLILELGVADASGTNVPDALIEVLTPELRINGERVQGLRWDGRQLKAQVPNVYGESDIELEVTLDGGTFQRQIRKTVANRRALLSELLVSGEGLQWRLYPADRSLVFDQVTLGAQIAGPVTRELELQRHDSGYFYFDLPADMPDGDYTLTLTGDAGVNGRRVTDFGVAPIDLALPLAADWPRILNPEAMPAEPAAMMPEPEPEAAFIKEPMPEFEELNVQTPVAMTPADTEPMAETTPPVQSEPIPWLRYFLYSLPGLLVLVAFFLIYRRLDQRSKGEAEDLLAEDQGMADEALTELDDLELTAGLDEASMDEGMDDMQTTSDDDQDAPVIDDVFEADEPEPSPPERTEAPRVSMEDSLDTRSLDEDVWGELDSEPDPLEGGEDDDLFDISNLEDGLSDLENLNLDEDDPFRDDSDDDTDDDTPKR